MALGKTSRGTILKSYLRGGVIALCVLTFVIVNLYTDFKKYDQLEALFAFGILGVIFQSAAAGLGLLRVLPVLTFVLELLIDIGLAVLGIAIGAIVVDRCNSGAMEFQILCRVSRQFHSLGITAIVSGILCIFTAVLTLLEK